MVETIFLGARYVPVRNLFNIILKQICFAQCKQFDLLLYTVLDLLCWLTCLTSCFMLLKVCFADYSLFELIGYTRLWDCLYWLSFVFRSTHVKYCHRFDLLTINTRSCLICHVIHSYMLALLTTTNSIFCYIKLYVCFSDYNLSDFLLFIVVDLLCCLQPVWYLFIYCFRVCFADQPVWSLFIYSFRFALLIKTCLIFYYILL